MSDIDWSNEKYDGLDFLEVESLRQIFEDPNTRTSRRSISKEYYKWKILSNPKGNGILHVTKINNEIVGMASITPKSFLLNGEVIQSAELGDCFINPNKNRKGMFRSLLESTVNEALESGYDLIYGTPNAIALPGERKAGYDLIPSVKLENLVFASSPKSILQKRITNKYLKIILILPLYFSGLIINIFPTIIGIYSSLLNKKLSIKFDPISEFPNELIEKIQIDSKHSDIISERSKEYLDWRFIKNPDDYFLFTVKSYDNYIGYFVLKTGYWEGIKVGYVADYYFVNGNENAFDMALDFIIKFFKKRAVGMISAWSSTDSYYYKVLKRNLFYKYKDVPVICYKNRLGKKIINSDLSWHFTMADSDNI